MSALLIATCGRPGAVSSIFTAIVDRCGTGPNPVYGFTFGSGFDFGFGLGVGVCVLGVVIGAALVLGSELLPPVHAALASIVLAMITAVTVERVRLMSDPLPVSGLRYDGPEPTTAGSAPCRRCRRTPASAAGRPCGTVEASAGRAVPACHGQHHCKNVARSARARRPLATQRLLRHAVAVAALRV